MTPEAILAHPAQVLSDPERRQYFAEGFVKRERHLPDAWLARLRDVTADLMARMAAGMADDLLTTLILATTAPVVIAPATVAQ